MDDERRSDGKSEDVCVFCGRALKDKEGRFIRGDAVYCIECYDNMKLEPCAGEDDVEGE